MSKKNDDSPWLAVAILCFIVLPIFVMLMTSSNNPKVQNARLDLAGIILLVILIIAVIIWLSYLVYVKREFLKKLAVYSYRQLMSVRTEGLAEVLTTKDNLRAFCVVLAIVVFLPVSLLLSLFIPAHLWILSCLLVLVVVVPAASIAAAKYEPLVEYFAANGFKQRIRFEKTYKVRWLSKEFDEFVGQDLIDLRNDAYALASLWQSSPSVPTVHDYSFIVVPMSKAYEGFLKKILMRYGVVEELKFAEKPDESINKYFNPKDGTSEKIYIHLRDARRDKAVPHEIFATYQEYRNQLVHYDTHRDTRVSTADDAKFMIRRIETVILRTYAALNPPGDPQALQSAPAGSSTVAIPESLPNEAKNTQRA